MKKLEKLDTIETQLKEVHTRMANFEETISRLESEVKDLKKQRKKLEKKRGRIGGKLAIQWRRHKRLITWQQETREWCKRIEEALLFAGREICAALAFQVLTQFEVSLSLTSLLFTSILFVLNLYRICFHGERKVEISLFCIRHFVGSRNECWNLLFPFCLWLVSFVSFMSIIAFREIKSVLVSFAPATQYSNLVFKTRLPRPVHYLFNPSTTFGLKLKWSMRL